MPSTKAIVAREPRFSALSWALEPVHVADTPGADEVLVEMVAAGVCHTDIVLSAVPEGSFGIRYPKVMGHEGSGYARKIGANVTGLEVGDPVLLSFYSCGECEQCAEQHPAYCHEFAGENYVGRRGAVTSAATPDTTTSSTGSERSDGKEEDIYSRFFGQSSFSRYSIVDKACVVNAKHLVNSEDELSLFAPLGCGFQTGMGAIENVARPTECDVVVVLGLGSVGLAALMTAQITPHKATIGIDRIASRLDLATTLGATHVINTSPDSVILHKAILSLYPNGVSVVIDTTGSPAMIEDGLKALRQRGKLILIGVPPMQYELGISAIKHMNAGRSIIGCIEGDCVPKEAVEKLIRWYREGKFPIDKLVTYFEAHEFKDALAGLDDGSVVKAVLKWRNV
ncbi:chaperonin 10-like protein [Aspergillus carlsbadensis]|nr:chaperonin 10-like protein [Aspergillus carlsbadensis]